MIMRCQNAFNLSPLFLCVFHSSVHTWSLGSSVVPAFTFWRHQKRSIRWHWLASPWSSRRYSSFRQSSFSSQQHQICRSNVTNASKCRHRNVKRTFARALRQAFKRKSIGISIFAATSSPSAVRPITSIVWGLSKHLRRLLIIKCYVSW